MFWLFVFGGASGYPQPTIFLGLPTPHPSRAPRECFKALQKLAQEISTNDGSFDKIKQMIQKMIFQLMTEQKDEDDQANWCAVDVETSTESKEDKTDKKIMMTRKVEEMEAATKLLVKQITENDARANQIKE